jgi:hypothetical protein
MKPNDDFGHRGGYEPSLELLPTELCLLVPSVDRRCGAVFPPAKRPLLSLVVSTGKNCESDFPVVQWQICCLRFRDDVLGTLRDATSQSERAESHRRRAPRNTRTRPRQPGKSRACARVPKGLQSVHAVEALTHPAVLYRPEVLSDDKANAFVDEVTALILRYLKPHQVIGAGTAQKGPSFTSPDSRTKARSLS